LLQNLLVQPQQARGTLLIHEQPIADSAQVFGGILRFPVIDNVGLDLIINPGYLGTGGQAEGFILILPAFLGN
jgi:hypothetical protein